MTVTRCNAIALQLRRNRSFESSRFGPDLRCNAYRHSITQPEKGSEMANPEVMACATTGCYTPSAKRGMCDKHYMRIYRAGLIKSRAPLAPREEVETYSAVHYRLRRDRGRAVEHFCSCGARAAQWAFDHSDPEPLTDPEGKVFSANPDRYFPLCTKCHLELDTLWRDVLRAAFLDGLSAAVAQ